MRAYNIVFIVIFMLMLAVPLVFVDLSAKKISAMENRVLAKRPPLSDIKKQPEDFIKKFDDWFKDNTGFREQMVLMHNAIDKAFSNRYKDGRHVYLVGEQGHHYFSSANGFLIAKFQGKKFLSDEQLQNTASKLENIKTYLESKGITLTVMFCTDKETIYPEFYPKSIKRGSEPIQLEVITEYLKTHTSADIFNIRQALLAEKDKYSLYPINNTRLKAYSDNLAHYNEVASFFAYRELMKHINTNFPQIVPYDLDDVEIKHELNGIYSVKLKEEPKYKKLDSSFFNNVHLIRPFKWENAAYENNEPDLPVILFFRDSYATHAYIGKFIAQHFRKSIFIHYSNIERLEKYINIYKPDIVVFETAERGLSTFANHIAKIPALE